MNNDSDIEQLLMSGRRSALPTEEKNAIKAVLMGRALKGLEEEARPVPSLWSVWVWRGAVSLASVFVVFVGTAFAAQDSLPGEPLYLIKVHVVEEMVSLTKIDPVASVAYDVALMEVRLNELKLLGAQEEAPAPSAVAVVAGQIDEHVVDLTQTLRSSDTTEVVYEKKLETLSRVAAIVRAQSRVVEQADELAPATETLVDLSEEMVDEISSTVDDFSEDESVPTVNDYLSKQISSVGEEVDLYSDDEITQERVEQHLQDVSESLIEGDVSGAIISVLEAQQEIAADEYTQQELVP